MSKKPRVKRIVIKDLSKLSVAIKLGPVAKYPDGTWGGQVQNIMINGLPNPEEFFDKFVGSDNKTAIFLTIENLLVPHLGKIVLEKAANETKIIP